MNTEVIGARNTAAKNVPIPTSTYALGGLVGNGQYIWAMAPMLPPSIAPTKSVGANMPPGVPAAKQTAVTAIFTSGDPGGIVARVATFVPPAAPMVLPVRAAAGELPMWEAVAGVGLVVATIAVVVPLAARIYAGGALFTKGQIKLRTALSQAEG